MPYIFFSCFSVCLTEFLSSASSLFVPVSSPVSVQGFCSFPVCLCLSWMLTWFNYSNRNKDILLLLSSSTCYWVQTSAVWWGHSFFYLVNHFQSHAALFQTWSTFFFHATWAESIRHDGEWVHPVTEQADSAAVHVLHETVTKTDRDTNIQNQLQWWNISKLWWFWNHDFWFCQK